MSQTIELSEASASPDVDVNGSRLPWPVWLLAISIVFPLEMSVYVGGLLITMNRLVLLVAFFPALFRLLQSGRLSSFDWCVFAAVLWVLIAIIINHGLAEGIESGGIEALQIISSYLIARAYITSSEVFLSTVKLLLGVAFLMAVLAIPEALTGVHYVKEAIASITGQHFFLKYEIRGGLTRAYASFAHPILLGVYCSSLFGVYWHVFRHESGKLRNFFGVIIGTAMSLSSAPFLLLGMQALALLWNKLSGGNWKLGFFIIATIYLSIDLFSNRTPLEVMFTYLLFNPFTGYIREIIWEYGFAAVLQNPFFGIGFHDWYRPFWLTPSVDNFWLVLMMRFGIPMFVLVVTAITLIVYKVSASSIKEGPDYDRLVNIKKGWVLSFVSLCLVGATVHFWTTAMSYFFFFMGAGCWLIDHAGTETNHYETDE